MKMEATQSENCSPTELSSRLETQDMEEMKVTETTINELTTETGSQPADSHENPQLERLGFEKYLSIT